MKRYEFLFITKITFDNSVKNHHFMLKCIPGNYMFQEIYDETVTLLPNTVCTFDKDSFGNRTVAGSIIREHNIFEYRVSGKALLSRYKSAELLDRFYLYNTNKTNMSQEMERFASSLDLTGDIHSKALTVSKAVHNKMHYVPNSTDVNTTAAEAFGQGEGVCQDFTHVTIALLRNLKIPARYCVGLMAGEGETHAWVEYYDGSMWYGIDPTNDRIIEYGYIKIANGRDLSDCGVDRGCFIAGNNPVKQDINVTVKVGEIDA